MKEECVAYFDICKEHGWNEPFMVPDITGTIDMYELPDDLKAGDTIELDMLAGHLSNYQLVIEIKSINVGYKETQYYGIIIKSDLHPNYSPWADPECWNINLGEISFARLNEPYDDNFE
jgi:hypothetical protein